MRCSVTRNPMRLSTGEVRDVSSSPAARRARARGRTVSRLHRRANKRRRLAAAGGGRRARHPARGRSNHITPESASHQFSAPHTSFECASPWRPPGPCMILVRVCSSLSRLNLTRHRPPALPRPGREIKINPGPEDAIRFSRGGDRDASDTHRRRYDTRRRYRYELCLSIF